MTSVIWNKKLDNFLNFLLEPLIHDTSTHRWENNREILTNLNSSGLSVHCQVLRELLIGEHHPILENIESSFTKQH